MAGVRAKATRRRRQKTVAVVAVTVLIVGIPAIDQLRSGPDPVDTPDEPFPERVNGDTRIARGGHAFAHEPLGVAAYSMTGERPIESGVAITTNRTVDGHEYYLAEEGYDVAAGKDPNAQVEVPPLGQPAVVSYGGGSWFGGIKAATLDSKQGTLSPRADSVWTERLPDAKPHIVTVTRVRALGLEAFVAFYTPATD